VIRVTSSGEISFILRKMPEQQTQTFAPSAYPMRV
jgi:hypothetical protein